MRRLLQNAPLANWDQIRDSVVNLANHNYALKKLRQMKQGVTESVQAYGERMLGLAEDVYHCTRAAHGSACIAM